MKKIGAQKRRKCINIFITFIKQGLREFPFPVGVRHILWFRQGKAMCKATGMKWHATGNLPRRYEKQKRSNFKPRKILAVPSSKQNTTVCQTGRQILEVKTALHFQNAGVYSKCLCGESGGGGGASCGIIDSGSGGRCSGSGSRARDC